MEVVWFVSLTELEMWDEGCDVAVKNINRLSEVQHKKGRWRCKG